MNASRITAGCAAVFAMLCLSWSSTAEAASLLAPKKVCKNQDLPAGSGAARKSMICMTNYARARKGLKRYRHTKILDVTASHKASDIFRCKSFSHEACGRDFSYWQDRYGYLGSRCWLAGENIAWGGGSMGTVGSIFEAWMDSTGHRHAILDPSYTEMGVGEQHGHFNDYAGSSVWVQHFGSHRC